MAETFNVGIDFVLQCITYKVVRENKPKSCKVQNIVQPMHQLVIIIFS